MPCKMRKALNGLIAEPVLRSGTVRARPMYAAGPNAWVYTTPWYDGSGVFSMGKRSACSAQGNLPESTMTPPRELPCPPMYLVSEWTTMSAP
jgi:hypothetical protein